MKMRSCLSRFLLVLLSSQAAMASTIGKVSDADGKPIGGVEVSVVGNNKVEPAYTNPLGLFEIAADPNAVLQFEKDGYDPVTKTVSEKRVISTLR